MHHSTDGITHTTAFVTPVVEHWLEREIAQWFHPTEQKNGGGVWSTFCNNEVNINLLTVFSAVAI